jgi:uncharacterized protein (DUF305 family)
MMHVVPSRPVEDGTEIARELDERPPSVGLVWLALPIVLALVAGGLLTAFAMGDNTPGDRSVEAGFLRDMATHHAQAVRMAGIAFRRTEDDEIKWLAYDILTTQQGQIGIMFGWLDMWELPTTGLEPPMTWMGHEPNQPLPRMETALPGMDHEMGNAMPGMATDAEIAKLETLAPDAMDREFLRLMIDHHIGGVQMAEAALAKSSDTRIREWAETMVIAQGKEVRAMQDMLAVRP